MNGPPELRNDPSLPLGYGPLELLEVKWDTFQPGDADRLAGMAAQTVPEYEKRQAAYADACQYQNQLAVTSAELEVLGARAEQEGQRLLLSSANEIIAIGSASDVQALAARWRPAEDQRALLQEARNLLTYRRVPAARLRTLEAALSLRQIESLQASLLASLSYARTLEKLISAGIFQNDNRVALVSEETERARATAREAQRQVELAETALDEERKRQLAGEQQRLATGTITRAETMTAVPVYQGHVA